MKKSQPIRMCIACRSRHPQSTLIRLRQDDKEILAFDGKGRSFYLCVDCIENEKNLEDMTIEEFKKFSDKIEEDIFQYLTLESCINRRNSYGGTSKKNVLNQIKNAKKFLEEI